MSFKLFTVLALVMFVTNCGTNPGTDGVSIILQPPTTLGNKDTKNFIPPTIELSRMGDGVSVLLNVEDNEPLFSSYKIERKKITSGDTTYQDITPSFPPPTQKKYAFTDQSLSGGIYQYKATAIYHDGLGFSEAFETINLETVGIPEPPQAPETGDPTPSNLPTPKVKNIGVSGDTIFFEIELSNSEQLVPRDYTIFRYVQKNGTFVHDFTFIDQTGSSFSDVPTAQGTYKYILRANFSDGSFNNGPFSSEILLEYSFEAPEHSIALTFSEDDPYKVHVESLFQDSEFLDRVKLTVNNKYYYDQDTIYSEEVSADTLNNAPTWTFSEVLIPNYGFYNFTIEATYIYNNQSFSKKVTQGATPRLKHNIDLGMSYFPPPILMNLDQYTGSGTCQLRMVPGNVLNEYNGYKLVSFRIERKQPEDAQNKYAFRLEATAPEYYANPHARYISTDEGLKGGSYTYRVYSVYEKDNKRYYSPASEDILVKMND